MKAAILLSSLFLTTTLMAQESRKFEMISGISAHVKIKTQDENTQAAAFADGKENSQFIEGMLKKKGSPLAELKKKIELENCEEVSTSEDSWIDGCGEFVVTSSVRTEFGRGGWAEAGAGYTLFAGFRSDGTGRFFSSSHMIKIFEDVYAETNEETGDFSGNLLKTLSLTAIKELESSESDSIK